MQSDVFNYQDMEESVPYSSKYNTERAVRSAQIYARGHTRVALDEFVTAACSRQTISEDAMLMNYSFSNRTYFAILT